VPKVRLGTIQPPFSLIPTARQAASVAREPGELAQEEVPFIKKPEIRLKPRELKVQAGGFGRHESGRFVDAFPEKRACR